MMMSGDCQSQGLAEWLQGLGWSEGLQPCDLRKLNTPKMRSIWRHLQAHVVSTSFASTIRKNVLLARLEEENIFAGQLGNYKLDSVYTLNKLAENRKIEVEKDKIKDEIKTVDGKLQSEKCNLLDRIVKEKWERHKINEMEDKTIILKLKHAKLLKDSKKTEVDKEMIVHFQCPKTVISHNELSYQRSLVYKYVKNYNYPFQITDDDSEYLSEMMCAILKFKPDTILDGITQNAKEAVRSLSSKVDNSLNLGDWGSLNKNVIFKENLRDLKILVIRNQLYIHECTEKITSDLDKLQKEKEELVRAIKEIDKDYSNLKRLTSEENEFKGENIDYKVANNESNENQKCKPNKEPGDLVLDHILEHLKEVSVKETMQKKQMRLIPDDEALEDLKLSINSLTGKESELWREVEKKVNEVNMVTSAIFSNLLMDSGELNDLLAGITQLATDFVSETSQNCKRNICSSSELTDMIMKEIEVFQRTPMVSLQRKWDTSNEMQRVSLVEKPSNNYSSLVRFLVQTEEKNSVVNILMKYIWSLSINPQFH